MIKIVFLIFGEFILAMSILVSTNHCTPSTQFERQLNNTDEDIKINNTELLKESEENNTVSTLNETLFWTLPDPKNTTEGVTAEMEVQNTQNVKPEGDESFVPEENVKEQSNSSTVAIIEPAISADEASEEKNGEVVPQVSNDSFQIKGKIILPRKNCHAEIAVYESSDTKLTIKFGHLQNNSYGRCCITLSGHENSMLGVLISDVHLYRNNTQGEVLKVIVGDHYSAFVLKEYYGSKNYEPLLLTETHKVYLVLYYKVGTIAPNQDCTYFNLEVFTYPKYEKNIHHYEDDKDNYNHLYPAQVNQADEVYSGEEMSYFTPYIYNRIY